MKRKVQVSFPASCGELIQGIASSGIFLSSYAINLYNSVYVETSDTFQLEGLPEHSFQMIQQCLADFQQLGITVAPIKIEIRNHIPYEKGMGSSTADLAGILYALYTYYDVPINYHTFAQKATSIEPTDSLIYPNLTLMNPDNGECLASMEIPDNLSVICLEPTKRVNTLECRKILTHYQNDAYQGLYEETLKSFNRQSFEDVLDLCQISAEINQQYNEKPYLTQIMKLQQVIGVKAINVSHTGSVIGIIYDSKLLTFDELSERIAYIDKLSFYHVHDFQMVTPMPKINIEKVGHL